MLISGSHRMRRARGPRGVSHSACALALTSTDRLNESCARHRAAAGSVPSQPMSLASAPRPALLGRRHSALLGRIDGSAGHNARVPVVDVRCGQRAWRMARPAWRRAGGGRCVEIWRLRPPRAASGGASRQVTSRLLCDFEGPVRFSSVHMWRTSRRPSDWSLRTSLDGTSMCAWRPLRYLNPWSPMGARAFRGRSGSNRGV